MARIMVVGGGKWQCPFVKMAKNAGHYVICTNLYEDSPAFKFTDAYAVANVLDKHKNLEIAQEYDIDAVITSQSDIAVPTVAFVAEKMGLKGIGSEVAKRFTNKHIMRDLTAKAGFASPRYRLCHNLDEAVDFVKIISPSIIKPLDSQSSRGVHIVSSEKEILAYWEDCISYSKSEKALVIEEYIDGIEFTVDGLKTEDSYYVTAISQKEHFKDNPSVANRLLFSRDNTLYDYEKLRQLNKEMVTVLGLPFGLTHAEYKYYNGDYYLIEIAARGGGTRISSDIVPLLTGINPELVLLDILLGSSPNIQLQVKEPYVSLGFLNFNPGMITSISGVEEAKLINGVYDLEIELSVGNRLNAIHDDRSRPGYYIVYGDSMENLTVTEQLIKDLIKVKTR